MRNFLAIACITVLAGACGVKEQADALQALQKCTYEVASADSVYIAGTNVKSLVTNNGLNLLKAPRVAMAFFQQQVPLTGILQLKITNPGEEEAGINQFDYKILIEGVEVLTGVVDKKITVQPNGGSGIVPIKIDKDIYGLLSSSVNQQAVADFLSSSSEKKARVTFKIKPGFLVGNEIVKYPDYIDIDNEVSNLQVLSYIRAIR